ncbi:MAG TPA: DUF5985 family protein [Methylomirabilota bacterium]|nr:DUF5985 family protein [Methylomirabilota bacterium]
MNSINVPAFNVLLNAYLSGAVMLGYIAIGYYFFRFWQGTLDRFFAVFAAAFWVLAVERVILLLTNPEDELRPYVYLVRLTAFILIIWAIIDKNRPATKS